MGHGIRALVTLGLRGHVQPSRPKGLLSSASGQPVRKAFLSKGTAPSLFKSDPLLVYM